MWQSRHKTGRPVQAREACEEHKPSAAQDLARKKGQDVLLPVPNPGKRQRHTCSEGCAKIGKIVHCQNRTTAASYSEKVEPHC